MSSFFRFYCCWFFFLWCYFACESTYSHDAGDGSLPRATLSRASAQCLSAVFQLSLPCQKEVQEAAAAEVQEITKGHCHSSESPIEKASRTQGDHNLTRYISGLLLLYSMGTCEDSNSSDHHLLLSTVDAHGDFLVLFALDRAASQAYEFLDLLATIVLVIRGIRSNISFFFCM